MALHLSIIFQQHAEAAAAATVGRGIRGPRQRLPQRRTSRRGDGRASRVGGVSTSVTPLSLSLQRVTSSTNTGRVLCRPAARDGELRQSKAIETIKHPHQDLMADAKRESELAETPEGKHS